MPHVIGCPNCSKRYQVADSSLGKRVRCQQCGTTFTAANAATSSPTAPLAASDPFDSLAGVDLSHFPMAPTSVPLHGRENPRGSYAASNRGNAGVSNPSGGPTDAKMRLVACGMLGFGLVLTVGSLVIDAFTGTVFMFVLALVPLMLVLGITGLIAPNVVRAIGQYGGHLPVYYKVIGWGLIGFSILLIFPVMIGLFVAGFRTDVPLPPPQVPLVNPAPPASYPAPPAMAPPATAEEKVARTNDPGVKEVLNPSGQFPIQSSSAETPRLETANDSRGVDSKPKSLKSYPVTIAVPSDAQVVPADAKLQPGTRLQACWAGKWNPITFLSANNDGTLTVRWDDFGAAFDCSMIRNELIINKDGLK